MSDKPLSFELSIGNAGNSLDGEHLSGKVDHVDTHAHEEDGKKEGERPELGIVTLKSNVIFVKK